jgi:HEAT repeat protein
MRRPWGSSSPSARLEAVRSARTTEELIAALDDPSPEVARAAIAGLQRRYPDRAAGELRSRLLSADPSLTAELAGALQRLGDRAALELAVAGLSQARLATRLAAARALGVLGMLAPDRARAALRGALGDHVAGVRAAALDALAQLGAPSRTDSVEQRAAELGLGRDCARLLADEHAHVRIAAIRALARAARRPGTLLAAAIRDPDPAVRIELARRLAWLPTEAAAALLADRALRVRQAAALGAGIGQLAQLGELLRSDPSPEVRRAAAKRVAALAQSGGAQSGGAQSDALQDGGAQSASAQALLAALEDPDSHVRATALDALERSFGPAGAVAVLERELASARAQRRRASLYALARLRARPSGRRVESLRNDPDPSVRLALLQVAEQLLAAPEALLHALAADPDARVRGAAEVRLAQRRNRPAATG